MLRLRLEGVRLKVKLKITVGLTIDGNLRSNPPQHAPGAVNLLLLKLHFWILERLEPNPQFKERRIFWDGTVRKKFALQILIPPCLAGPSRVPRDPGIIEVRIDFVVVRVNEPIEVRQHFVFVLNRDEASLFQFSILFWAPSCAHRRQRFLVVSDRCSRRSSP